MSKYTRRGREMLKGMDVRHGGRTIKFEAFVNTDASEEEIKRRLFAIREAACGETRDMVIGTAGEVSAEQAERLWAAAISAARDAAGEKKD